MDFVVSLISRKPALRLLSRLLAKTYSQIFGSTFLCQLSTWLNVLAILAQLTLLICKCALRVARGTLTARTLARLYGDSNVPQPSFSPLYS